MNDKKSRQKEIKKMILTHEITSQDVLLNLLIDKGFDVTQATLSRDIKELKIVKAPALSGSYTYQFSDALVNVSEDTSQLSTIGFINIEFSGSLAVIKTRPGYAMAIAGEIDLKATQTILGTVAGDDTILIIPRENVSRQDVIASLAKFIPNI
jgi:transcriptional regulator of arginine metabolism